MMRTFGSFVLAAAVAVTATAAVQAQQGQGPRGGAGMGMGGPMLLMNKSVQDELKLDAGQVEKVEKIAREQFEKVRGEMQGLRDLSPEERREKMESVQQTMRRGLFQALREGEVMNRDQVRRFMQIDLQQRGPVALTSPWISQRLNLTEEQKTKIQSVLDEQMAKVRELMQGAAEGDRAERMQKFSDLRKETSEKAAAVLTDEQKEQWKSMIGEPFQITWQRPNQ